MRMLRTNQHSFGAGVVSPELYGRVDLSKYNVALSTANNFIVSPHGPVDNRAGLEFIKETNDSTKASRIIEFIFSTTQAYALEFGDQYMRVHTEGGTVLEAAQNVTAATTASAAVLTIASHGYATGDEVYLDALPGDFAALNGKYHKITVLTVDTFSVAVDSSAYAAYTTGGTASRVFTLTTPYAAADVFGIRFVQSADVLTLVHESYAPQEVRRISATSWTIGAAVFGPTIAAPTSPAVAATVGSGSTTYDYVVTSVSATQEESLVTAGVTCTNDLTTAGNYNTVTWTDEAAAIRYNIYKKRNGLYGYVGQALSGGAGFIDDNISADMLTSPPQNRTPFGSAGNYPRTVSYFEQRRLFASTVNAPETVWMTRSGTEGNLSYSVPSQADDAIVFELASRQLNTVLDMVPLSDLILLTNVGEWKVTSQNTDAITPTSIWVRPQGYTGSNDLPAIVASSSVLFSHAQGSHFSDMAYSLDQQIYKARDLSVLVPHLFEGYTFVDWCFVRAPYPIIWAVRSDGVLVAFTYLPEQDVLAYHTHTTVNGAFESVAAIPEGGEDKVYAVVNRTIGGVTKRYVERLGSRVTTPVADAFFVDSGQTYSGAPTSVITGLDHLEGQTVAILADGSVQAPRAVSGGRITLDVAATKVHVGLPITGLMTTLPLVLQLQGLGQGLDKNIAKAFIRVDTSRGIWAGPDTDNMTEYSDRVSEAYGDPTQLFSKEIEVLFDSLWSREASVSIRITDPVPASILSISAEVAVGA